MIGARGILQSHFPNWVGMWLITCICNFVRFTSRNDTLLVVSEVLIKGWKYPQSSGQVGYEIIVTFPIVLALSLCTCIGCSLHGTHAVLITTCSLI
jgi:hypothetical protein